MSVATWLKSVFTTQTATNYKANIDACFAVAERIVDNFAPRQSTTPAMTVTLDAGALYNGQTLTEVAAQTTGTITAPVGNPRIDRIVINKATGAVSVISGTPAGSPVAPALTQLVYPIAQVLLQTTSTTIVNSMITDERSVQTDVANQFIHSPSKATPVGADALALWNSVTGFLNYLTLTNLAGLCSAGWNANTATNQSGGTVNATTINASGLITATGGQIAFPATAVPSANANTLDDYEEGTWTPVVSGGTVAGTGTYTAQAGKYTKIGNLCFLSFYVSWTAHTGTGELHIGGLPFTFTNSFVDAISIAYLVNITLPASTLVFAKTIYATGSISLSTIPLGGGSDTPLAIDSAGTIGASGTALV